MKAHMRSDIHNCHAGFNAPVKRCGEFHLVLARSDAQQPRMEPDAMPPWEIDFHTTPIEKAERMVVRLTQDRVHSLQGWRPGSQSSQPLQPAHLLQASSQGIVLVHRFVIEAVRPRSLA